MLNVTLNVGEIVLSKKEADKLFECVEAVCKRLKYGEETVDFTINIDTLKTESDAQQVSKELLEKLNQSHINPCRWS